MLEWLENYVKSLVSLPEQVSVSAKDGVKVIVVSIKVAADDYGLFAGRQNRLVKAMTSAASLAGAKERTRYVLKVSDHI